MNWIDIALAALAAMATLSISMYVIVKIGEVVIDHVSFAVWMAFGVGILAPSMLISFGATAWVFSSISGIPFR